MTVAALKQLHEKYVQLKRRFTQLMKAMEERNAVSKSQQTLWIAILTVLCVSPYIAITMWKCCCFALELNTSVAGGRENLAVIGGHISSANIGLGNNNRRAERNRGLSRIEQGLSSLSSHLINRGLGRYLPPEQNVRTEPQPGRRLEQVEEGIENNVSLDNHYRWGGRDSTGRYRT